MKYSPELYAKAFFEAARAVPEKKQGEIISRFLQVIRKNGDWPLIKKIFRQVCSLVIRARGGRMIVLEFARDLSKELVNKLQNSFSKQDYVEKAIRPELIAGVRILIDYEKELDLTVQRKLRNLFTN